jgi:hypothetical protein
VQGVIQMQQFQQFNQAPVMDGPLDYKIWSIRSIRNGLAKWLLFFKNLKA